MFNKTKQNKKKIFYILKNISFLNFNFVEHINPVDQEDLLMLRL